MVRHVLCCGNVGRGREGAREIPGCVVEDSF